MEGERERRGLLFKSVGFDETNAVNIAKNDRVAESFENILSMCGVPGKECGKSKAMLLYTVCTRISVNATSHIPLLVEYIMKDKLKSLIQVESALRSVNSKGREDIDLDEFSSNCGIGVEINESEMDEAVRRLIDMNKKLLEKERYKVKDGKLLASLKKDERLRWADMKVMKEKLSKSIHEFLGPMTEEDKNPSKKSKEKKQIKKTTTPKPEEEEKKFTTFGECVGRELLTSVNNRKLLEEHNKVTGGHIRTRFPPEPNGLLHIGHAKAITFDFGYAQEQGGVTYLRYDDTNPEAEKTDYITSIMEDVEWLGYTPWKVTYSSDYFEELYEIAVRLIKKRLAYVDHQTREEMREYREKRMPSPYRDRPVEESLQLFGRMRSGRIEEGKATLRLKMDYAHDNPNMRDVVAYRIKFTPHPHAGDKWCVYPSYDYTHCLVDSLEHVSHSLCTLEFESRRESYFWLLEAAEIYKPNVWEFSRLNMTNMVVSKRKLNNLVQNGYVRGWDDPRLLTISGMRRRGYTPEGINDFCKRIGVSRNENLIDIRLLEQCVRLHLDKFVPRRMCVVNPLRITLTNFSEVNMNSVSMPNHPKDESMGTRTVELTNELFIERSDFRMEDERNYFGLAPNKEVRLRYCFNIRCDRVVMDDNGEVSYLECTALLNSSTKVKGFIHWKSQPIELRLYDVLFKDKEPSGESWLEGLNSDSEKVVKSVGEASLKDAKIGDKFQFERVGFFCVDSESSEERLALNRTATLKDSYPK